MFNLYDKFPGLLQSAVILLFAYLLHWFLKRSIGKILGKLNDKGYQTTRISFIKNSLGFLIYGLAIMLIILNVSELRNLGKSLLAGAGIFAAIIGFASREAFADIINGIFLIIYKPFQIDDIITLDNGMMGIVTDITFRHTVIKDFENQKIIVPNSSMGNKIVTNSSMHGDFIKKRIDFKISFDSNVDQARKIIQEVIEVHPNCLDRRNPLQKKNNDPIVEVLMTEWLEYGVNLRAFIWTPSLIDAYMLGCEVIETIKSRFDEEGIIIPYPQMEIKTKN